MALSEETERNGENKPASKGERHTSTRPNIYKGEKLKMQKTIGSNEPFVKSKIAYLINGLGPGGAEAMLFRLLQKLDRSVFDPEVIALLDIPGPVSQKISDLGVTIHIIKFKSKIDLFSIFRLFVLLKQKKPEILHTQLFAADIIGRILGRLIKTPIIISSIRNTYYGRTNRDYLIKWTERFTMRTTIVSRASADRFIRKGIIPKEKLKVIYNGIDPKAFYHDLNDRDKAKIRAELGLHSHDLLLLSVGSLSKQKGYKYLLSAISIVNRQNISFKLIIAGTGELKTELVALAKGHSLEGSVKFLGLSDNVPKLMAVADALVLSSLWEGLPGVVLEAMASELPVVATAVGGTPELVVDGVTGYLVPPESPEELASALQKVMEMSCEERTAMGQAGRERVKKHFHVDKMVAAYENLYLECLREKNLLKVADDEY